MPGRGLIFEYKLHIWKHSQYLCHVICLNTFFLRFETGSTDTGSSKGRDILPWNWWAGIIESILPLGILGKTEGSITNGNIWLMTGDPDSPVNKQWNMCSCLCLCMEHLNKTPHLQIHTCSLTQGPVEKEGKEMCGKRKKGGWDGGKGARGETYWP